MANVADAYEIEPCSSAADEHADHHHLCDLVGPSSVADDNEQRHIAMAVVGHGVKVQQKPILQDSHQFSAVLTDDEDDVVEVEELHGTVVRGPDGQFYVSLNDEVNFDEDDEIDLEQFDNVFVTVNAADGAHLLVFDDTERSSGSRSEHRLDTDRHAHSPADEQRKHHGMRRDSAQKSSPIVSFAADDYGDADICENIGGIEQHRQQQQYSVRSNSPMSAVFDEDVAQEEVVQCEEDTFGEHGFKLRHSRRVFGGHRCFECGQTFVNMARLERHLSVHQQYGLYLCPLCNKTYKYEYNLFFHWRNTCREMNELLSQEERKSIEINVLRQLVEEIAHKKVTIGPLELDASFPPALRRALPPILRQNCSINPNCPTSSFLCAKLARCSLCGLTVYDKHLPTHRVIHYGERPVDGCSVGGAFFCDLCGLAFRTRANLIRHWRTGCSTIHANLPPNSDFALDDAGLKQMVVDLLKKLTTERKDSEAFSENLDDEIGQPSTSHKHQIFNTEARDRTQIGVPAKAVSKRCHDDQQQQYHQTLPANSPQVDEKWAQAEGIFFADDFSDEDIATTSTANNGHSGGGTLLQFNADGRLVTVGEQDEEERLQLLRSRALPLPGTAATIAARQRTAPPTVAAAVVVPAQPQHGAQAVWPKLGEAAEEGRFQCIQYTPQSVQCSECYRSFSSVQRLEKHMAGAHCSFGTHHCLLCGSRFKYEYNLFFHYRQVCPYTLKMISAEMRQQLESVDLKKTVRRIAAASTASSYSSLLLPHLHGGTYMPIPSVPVQSAHSASSWVARCASSAAMQQQLTDAVAENVNDMPSTSSSPSVAVATASTADGEARVPMLTSSSVPDPLSTAMVPSTHNQPELGDSVIRRQMMKKIIQKHRRHQGSSSASANLGPLPQQLLQPVVRPNLPDGMQCPICAIVFYGLKVLVRHLRAAHPNESSVWEHTLSALGSSSSSDNGGAHCCNLRLSSTTKHSPSRLSTTRKRKIFRDSSEDQPPQLELADCVHVDSAPQRMTNHIQLH
ncbi:hypothetical protein niasHS_014196 [Heterodera schachtii]|uniref:C2H2-type domain-containing protein n=1 Tax=Heterodera schachtii TaxID=97005 RepID=A0ABD2I652_HETSC